MPSIDQELYKFENYIVKTTYNFWFINGSLPDHPILTSTVNNHPVHQPHSYTTRVYSGLAAYCYRPVFWFHHPSFLNSRPCSNPVLFQLWNDKNGQVEACFTLFVTEKLGLSTCRAPFGSIEFRPQLPLSALTLLCQTMDDYALANGLEEISIISYPFCYHEPTSALLTACLLQNNFVISTTDLNFHIPITTRGLAAQMHSSEKRRLHKCLRQGLRFSEEKAPDLEQAYQFISTCRQRRGFPTTLDFPAFVSLFRDFPEVYRLVTVKDEERIVALATAVVVSESILYYFLPADDEAYKTLSPTVLLLDGLYNYAQSHGFRLLDLGIATASGVPNHGLIRFKQNMGGQPSLKLSFRKRYYNN